MKKVIMTITKKIMGNTMMTMMRKMGTILMKQML